MLFGVDRFLDFWSQRKHLGRGPSAAGAWNLMPLDCGRVSATGDRRSDHRQTSRLARRRICWRLAWSRTACQDAVGVFSRVCPKCAHSGTAVGRSRQDNFPQGSNRADHRGDGDRRSRSDLRDSRRCDFRDHEVPRIRAVIHLLPNPRLLGVHNTIGRREKSNCSSDSIGIRQPTCVAVASAAQHAFAADGGRP